MMGKVLPLVLILTVSLYFVSCANTANTSQHQSADEAKWNEYKKQYQTGVNSAREWAAKEWEVLKANFMNGLSHIKGAASSANKTTEEKQKEQLALQTQKSKAAKAQSKTKLAENIHDHPDLVDHHKIPSAYDLRQTHCGKSIPIPHQGKCQSSWASSAIFPIEFAHCQKHGKYVPLSEQFLISCDRVNDGGCESGDPSHAFQYLMETTDGELPTNASFPFHSKDGNRGQCKSNAELSNLDLGATLKTWKILPCAKDSKALKTVPHVIQEMMLKNGVVSTCILVTDVDKFTDYRSGVYSDPKCPHGHNDLKKYCGDEGITNHCMTLVGWGTDSHGKDYWIARNTWGHKWGMGGYMHIQRGVNMCGVESEVYTVTVA